MKRTGHKQDRIRRAATRRMTESYSRFLQARRVLRHFGRHPLIDSFASHGPAAAAPAPLEHALLKAARETPAAALTRLATSTQGLSPAEAALRLRRDGPNEVAHEAPLPAWLHLWHCYKNPFNLLLSVLALLSWFGADAKATAVITVMVLLSTVVRFVQEGRSHHAAESLRALVSNTSSVIRSTVNLPQPAAAQAQIAHQEIAQHDLVAGDILALSAGDMIPADCRVLSARDLFIAQAAMTGESLPVEKFAEQRSSSDQLLEQDTLVFMGTSVVSGTATALVLATGGRSYFGSLALKITASDLAPNAFQSGVNRVSWVLIRFALVMVPIVLLVNGFTKGDWSEALLFALSVAVGLTPEMLPMIVTSTLAKGAVILSRKKVIVKRLDAIQNFGAMDVLCTDKTGTLTQDRIALARHADGLGAPSERVLDYAFLNSYYQTGLKNLLDRAVLSHVELATELRLKQDYSKVDELPFDFERRRMSVVVARKNAAGQDSHLLICKGAVEEVLAICNQLHADTATAQDSPFDAAARERANAFAQGLNAEGLRVVALAMKELPSAQTRYTIADETALSLVGFIGFLDPPKESATPALKALAAHGIVVKVLSGDNALVSARVCQQVGLPASTVLLGAQLDEMNDAALGLAVEQHQIFAKLTPLHKERIVRALRAAGHVVGFMGDGINDAPALRAADIGISVDSAVDIAKEAADVILLEKSLMVLDAGVIEGRTTFCNMLKYIRMTASSNFGNVLSVLVASAFLPFLPMLPLQLLLQNLLYDFAQTAIPFDNVDAEQVSQPLKWHPDDITRFMIFFGPISSLFDISSFAILWWVFKANDLAHQGLFQSGWFLVGLLTQTLVVHMIRTPKLPFIESRAAAPLLGMTALIMALGIWLPMGPLAAYFKLQALPPAYFLWLGAILIAYCLLTTLMKRLYIRHFGWQ